MNITTLLFTFLIGTAFTQVDTVYIEFLKTESDDSIYVYPVNGEYFLDLEKDFAQPIIGALYINPHSMLEVDLHSYSYKQEFKDLAPYVYQSEYLHEISKEKAFELVNDIIEDQYYYWSNENLSSFSTEELESYFGIIRLDQTSEKIKAESKNGIFSGVYISKYFIDMDYLDAHPRIKDSLNSAHQSYRNTISEHTKTQYLSPFYISQTEVTNKQYNDFKNWVIDSVARELIFHQVEDDNTALTLLNIDKKQRKLIENVDREALRKKYSLNYKSEFNRYDKEINRILDTMYYPAPERFYARRTLDQSRLNYLSTNGEFISLEVDTLGFSRSCGEGYMEFHENLYAWHPYFDNYPVLNLNLKQMQAYCDWYQKKINEDPESLGLKKDLYQVNVSIPSIHQYEMALKGQLYPSLEPLARNHSNEHYITFDRAQERQTYLNKVYQKSFEVKRKTPPAQEQKYVAFNRWYANNHIDRIHFLNGNASEVTSDLITQESLNYYGISTDKTLKNSHFVLGSNYKTEVKTIGDDQYNALFYKRIRGNNESDATTGFRLVFTIVSNETN